MPQVERILIVASSMAQLGDTDQKTGVWVEEIAVPYYLFLRKGYIVDIASTRGGSIPLDPASTTGLSAKHHFVKRFLTDPVAQVALSNTIAVAYVDAAPYAAIFIPGGHGIAWDGPYNEELKRLVEEAYEGNNRYPALPRFVAAVCHGPVALLRATDREGLPILAGKQVTGFSNSEEEASGRAALVPFLLEDKLKQVGGQYRRSPRDGGVFAVRSGQVITGQNPASSQKTAELVVEALSYGVRLTL